MWLVDSNILTRIEVLGFHRFTENEEQQLQSLLSAFEAYPISDHTAYHAINLRKQRRMTLGDSLIAATCIEHGLKLASRNTADFIWIPNLTVDSLSQYAD